MSVGAPIAPPPGAADPSTGLGGGGGGGGGAGGGQGVQILQQIQDLLSQLGQVESDPAVQRAVSSMQQLVDPLMQAVGSSDAQDMTSGLSNPGGPGDASADAGGGAPDMSGMGGLGAGPDDGSGGGAEAPPSKSFGGAKKAAMANFGSKGHFSKSGSKGESLQTDKTKNRNKK